MADALEMKINSQANFSDWPRNGWCLQLRLKLGCGVLDWMSHMLT